MALTKSEMGCNDGKEKHSLRIDGLTPVLFDRYAGDNDTKLTPAQKLYLNEGREICLPSANIMSLLSSQNTDSAPKRLLDSRKYKRFAAACSSYAQIEPAGYIKFHREGSPIVFGQFEGTRDKKSGCTVEYHVARLEKGIPNPKERPCLHLPWRLEFEITLWPNKELQWQQLLNLLTEAMIAIGIGTFRGQYGKGRVSVIS